MLYSLVCRKKMSSFVKNKDMDSGTFRLIPKGYFSEVTLNAPETNVLWDSEASTAFVGCHTWSKVDFDLWQISSDDASQTVGIEQESYNIRTSRDFCTHNESDNLLPFVTPRFSAFSRREHQRHYRYVQGL